MNVIATIYRKLRYILRWIVLYHRFGAFGKGSFMMKPLRLMHAKGIHIGKDVVILPLARMECVWENQAKNAHGEIHIGDRTSIEQNCHIIAGNRLEIGKDVTISAFVYIADCGHDIVDVTGHITENPLVVKKTTIGDGAFVGIGAKIMPGTTIGKYAIIGANAVVCRDVPDYTMVAGVPAKIIKQYDKNIKQWVAVNN